MESLFSLALPNFRVQVFNCTHALPCKSPYNLKNSINSQCKCLNFVTAQTVDTVLKTALNGVPEQLPAILNDIPEEVKAKQRKSFIQQ